MKILPLALFIIPFLAGCGANNTPPQTPIPGEKTSAKLRTLETGAAAILNEDVMQAVIYDGNTKNARLMGVEYIISERLFKTLPPEEKKLWHSHQYEVKSGSLVAPGLPQVADKALMSKIVNTYGKTWHTWHTDRDKTLPMGIPALMMGFTGDGQLDPALLADRDRRLGIDTQAIKRERQDLPEHPVVKGANAWEQGEVIQLQRVQGSGEHGRGDTAHFGTSEQSRQ
ncbi:OBAP family protein [Salmonella enterica subsp. enterica serovar Typhimurium]|nr:OBAP family protein [Salmonella enterica subsp. enterica serovar Typhimurium]